MTDTEHLEQLSRLVRSHILRMTTAAGSGHMTSSLSAVELMVGLLFGGMFRADLANPKNPMNDRLVFSKGHASPLLYALYSVAGKVTPRELLRYRTFGSRLEGHPLPTFRYVDVPTGSLGQGLSIGIGEALAGRMDRLGFRTYVLLGDSEMAEGSIWEAIQYAGFAKLDTLTAVLDANRLGQSGPTMIGRDLSAIARRVESFGWRTLLIDGHDVNDILKAYATSMKTKDKPTMIIAKTIKGRGVSFLEDREGWHGRALDRKELKKALTELGRVNQKIRGMVAAPPQARPRISQRKKARKLRYRLGEMVATREAFGRALVRLAPTFPKLIVLDGEVKNSTFTELFARKYPARFIEAYVAEQHMVSMAGGLAARGKLPVVATFAAFFTRAFDQLRLAQYARTHQVFAGSHAGVSVGQDGPSQMGLEDVALFRALEHTTILYPADALATEKLLERSLKAEGIVYLRLTRAETPVIYSSTTPFTVGGSRVLRSSGRDRATILAAGITLHEALRAVDALAKRNILVRLIDLYSIQPIDVQTLHSAAQETGPLLVVEDHRPAGGIAEAARSALGAKAGIVTSLAVRKTPKSGRPEEQLRYQGLDASSIVQTLKKLIHVT